MIEEKKVKRYLFLLHLTPPLHGASLMGDRVKDAINKKGINATFLQLSPSLDIKSVNTISFNKVIRTILLFWSVLYVLVKVRPTNIYFTPSVGNRAVLRDYIFAYLFRLYSVFCPKLLVVNHIHMRPTVNSLFGRCLIRGVVKNSRTILMDETLKDDFDLIIREKESVEWAFLPNYVPNMCAEERLIKLLETRVLKPCFSVGFMGHLTKEKGFTRFILMAKKIHDGHDREVNFLIAGGFQSESYKEECIQLIKSSGLNESFDFRGFVVDDRKLDFFIECDVLIQPSYSEAYSLVLVEAQQMGIPVVATDVGANRRLVGNSGGVVCKNSTSDLLDLVDYSLIKEMVESNLRSDRVRAKSGTNQTQQFRNALYKILEI